MFTPALLVSFFLLCCAYTCTGMSLFYWQSKLKGQLGHKQIKYKTVILFKCPRKLIEIITVCTHFLTWSLKGCWLMRSVCTNKHAWILRSPVLPKWHLWFLQKERKHFWFHFFSGDKRQKKKRDDGRHDMKASVFKTLVQDWKDPRSRHSNVLGKINACCSQVVCCFNVFVFPKYFTLALEIKLLNRNCIFFLSSILCF